MAILRGSLGGRADDRVAGRSSPSDVPLRTGTVNLHDLFNGGDRTVTAADNCGGPSAISRDGMKVAYEHYCVPTAPHCGS